MNARLSWPMGTGGATIELESVTLGRKGQLFLYRPRIR